MGLEQERASQAVSLVPLPLYKLNYNLRASFTSRSTRYKVDFDNKVDGFYAAESEKVMLWSKVHGED